MLRLLVSFLVLFVGAAALIALLPKPTPRPASTSGVASELRAEARPGNDKPVRIVYPPTDGPTEASPAVPVNSNSEPTAITAAVASPQTARDASDAGRVDGRSPPTDAATGPDQTGKIDINTASADALDNIPGGGRIGRAIASRRPYRSVEDLLTKRVLRKSVYDRIKDQLAAKWDVAGAQ